ncbi:hypothetical protein [Streptomyces sp. NPDC023327]|uniref:hypothetical protein n=1 Tax=Streptomyces sp. NPDC023327 TaxID=3157088 RepID=UPI0034077004
MDANGHDSHPVSEKLGPLYPVAKKAAECVEAGMSIKEAVANAQATIPGGDMVTVHQVVQGMHNISAAGPDEELDPPADPASAPRAEK